jgi:putative hydrolase of the HAD superfamily
LLIIFDLDDTLIDTTGSVTPYKLKCCLERMIEGGLKVDNFDAALRELESLNLQFSKSKEALIHFAHGDKHLLNLALKALYALLPDDFKIPTTPHAKEVLEEFQQRFPLALVTSGQPHFQLQKLEKAGIDREIFSKIAIPEDALKKPHYEAILSEFSLSPNEVLVCGDRIPMDLKPAHELGCRTVHMRWGRGALMETETWIDYAISDLSELRGIIK